MNHVTVGAVERMSSPLCRQNERRKERVGFRAIGQHRDAHAYHAHPVAVEILDVRRELPVVRRAD